MDMKALSLKQPWAELILLGRKTIETRKWKTDFRGEFYIHASKSCDREFMERFGLENLATGALVGKAELVDIIEYKNEEEFLRDNDKHLAGELKFRRYGWVLRNVRRIEPVAYIGRLGLFEV